MIPTIGIMVGFYIVTRMLELIGRTDRGPWTKAMAYITIAVACLAMLDLLMRGMTTTRLLD